MSADLYVPSNTSVQIEDLLRSSRLALKEILQVPDTPYLTVMELRKGQSYLSTTTEIDEYMEGALLIGLEGCQETVSVNCFEAIDEANYQKEFSVVVGACKTPLEFALAASIAIALSRLSDSEVIDSANLWSLNNKQSCDDFIKSVSVHQKFNDITSSAEAMFSSCPIGQWKSKYSKDEFII